MSGASDLPVTKEEDEAFAAASMHAQTASKIDGRAACFFDEADWIIKLAECIRELQKHGWNRCAHAVDGTTVLALCGDPVFPQIIERAGDWPEGGWFTFNARSGDRFPVHPILVKSLSEDEVLHHGS